MNSIAFEYTRLRFDNEASFCPSFSPFLRLFRPVAARVPTPRSKERKQTRKLLSPCDARVAKKKRKRKKKNVDARDLPERLKCPYSVHSTIG